MISSKKSSLPCHSLFSLNIALVFQLRDGNKDFSSTIFHSMSYILVHLVNEQSFVVLRHDMWQLFV